MPTFLNFGRDYADARDGYVYSYLIEEKRPVFNDAGGVGWNVSVVHNAGLGRYLLCTEHSKSHAGRLGMFDAPEPWGPWTTVAYEEAWGEGHIEVSTFFWNLTQKWMSADGTKFTMIFTGKNSNDSWNTIEGQIHSSSTGSTKHAMRLFSDLFICLRVWE